MLPTLLSLESISPQLPEVDPDRAETMTRCLRTRSQVVCDHTKVENIGVPSLQGKSGYEIQKVRIVEKGDGTTCATCRMPKFR